MTTSANNTEYTIFKDGEEIGHICQHAMCRTNWRRLLNYNPPEDYEIQAWGYDEEEEYWSNEQQNLNVFLEGKRKSIDREIHAERVDMLLTAADGMSNEDAVKALTHYEELVKELQGACFRCRTNADHGNIEMSCRPCRVRPLLANLNKEGTNEQ